MQPFEETIEVWDSFGTVSSEKQAEILNLIVFWKTNFWDAQLDQTRNIIIKNPSKGKPIQPNGSRDCAIYTLLFALKIISGYSDEKVLDISLDDVKNWRLKLANEFYK
jgi:hypothetical protein